MASTHNTFTLSPKQRFTIEGQYLVYYYLEAKDRWEEVERFELGQVQQLRMKVRTPQIMSILSGVVFAALDLPYFSKSKEVKRYTILYFQDTKITYQLTDQS